MKKIFAFLFSCLLLVGFASAIYMPNDSGKNAQGQMQTEDGEPMYRIMATEQMQNGQLNQARLQAGQEIGLQGGKTLRLQGEDNRLRLQVGNQTAECQEDCNLTRNQSRIHATMSNGLKSEIKIMPDVASDRALERLRLRMCENCTLELKEVGEGNQTKMAYELRAKKRARVLGIFGADMPIQAQVDAETGEIIRSRRPWWSFLASESDQAEPIEE